MLPDQQVDQFIVEGGGVFGGAEVSVFHAPVADGLGHAGHQLTDAGFALVGADLSVQILRGDDVGRGHRPVFRDLDVLLLEDHASLGVGDLSGAKLPLDLVVGRHPGLGEEAAEGQAWGLRLLVVLVFIKGGLINGGAAGCGLSFYLVAHFGHFSLLIR